MLPTQLSGCDNCGSDRRNFFHDVRLRGVFRRLCSPCVLKSHPGLFCPLCFDLFIETPLERVLCSKCPSIAHLSCVDYNHNDVGNTESSSFVCPSCSDPQFVFSDESGIVNAIDLDSAKVIVAAARIAWLSLRRAAAAARAEAEWRVKEAALAKKRAREALERVASLCWDEEEKNERPVAQSPVSEVANGDAVKVKGSSDTLMGRRDSAKMVKKKKKKSSKLSQVQGHVLKRKKKKKKKGGNVKQQLRVYAKNGVIFNNGDAVNVKLRDSAKSKKKKKKKK